MKIRTRKSFAFLTALATVMLFSGCGGDMSSTGKTTMRLPEFGLVMDVPAGWKVDKNNPGMCVKGEYIGLLMSEPLGGRSFKGAVEEMSSEFGAKMLSRKETTFAGESAVKVLMDDPGGMRIFRVYLDCGNAITYASFAVPQEDFSSWEAAFEKSAASLRKE
jgi:hypothetical protein